MMNPASRPPSLIKVLMVVFAIAGLCINIFLLTRTLGDASIAGCGGGPCDEVLASRWSSLLGLPVPAFGILVYGLLLLSFFQRLEILRCPLLGCIAGGAVWFIAVQAFMLGKFCPWCMAAHGMGLAIVLCGMLSGKVGAWRHIGAWAGLAVFAIASMQVFGPVPARHRVEDSEIKIGQSRQSGAAVSSSAGGSLAKVSEHPFLGQPGAQGLLVEYFDYQCASCRVMAGYIDALVARHGGIKVQLMPVPLDGSCNPQLGNNKAHAGSCEVARIALAVWRRNPDSFAVFHKKLFADPSVETARALALGIMTQVQLEEALEDPWITQSIETNIAVWRKLSKTSEKLPKLVINGRRVLHGLPASEVEFMHAMRAEWGFD